MDNIVAGQSGSTMGAFIPPQCALCARAPLCHPESEGHPPRISAPVHAQRFIRCGESIYRAGDPMVNLYQLRSGSAKIRITNPSGLEQITAFPIAGALLGLDGIETGLHTCDAIALEDSLLCILPYAELLTHCHHFNGAAQLFNRMMAHDANQHCRLLLTLGCMTTEERIAGFLIGISEQMAANGYSPLAFTLKMTREDIANHLGMKVETVCRVLARLQEASMVKVSRRQLEISNVDALRQMSCG
ncbi:MAG: cyclic nucleotide-binding domain-containing protein [Achromobacter sp.]|uniref:Fumarate and nitrate reduction regulatory protein n=2 Tax=Alcaligenaceae TaxID=506 RepID=A0A6S7E4P4_9BURK|nr:helix-turn-helix domain-containing protein [Achromobacter piechaudii]MPS81271.1 cyclic nucleotide-binding domain-containing protein [Achromobacter sp.]CAB3738971.1 Fumarate and nitrate reduction regulatory protein [Achromobacter piechaudii]CAB3894271.1 Fumarate and nitrate reduction regulatory protein [Achromobacter piechaudii]CAB3919981.1 Fumarate and nitrate reduction regulatory protein [Achromobacter piechaudii]CAB3958656.1 Fumarate and nitrate reduction regulatory protein [Achromobacter